MATKLQTWMRVNPKNADDVRAALDFVPDEYQETVKNCLIEAGADFSCVVALYGNGYATVYEEGFFRKAILPKHEEDYALEEDEETLEEVLDQPAENGELYIFELESDKGRGALAEWAHRLLPGVDLVHLQNRTVVGDLIVLRPGSDRFEVFRKATDTTAETQNIRIQAAHLAFNSDRNIETNLNAAKALADWIQS